METLSKGIKYRHWPVENPKACVLLVHGLAEHSGRYEHVAARFNARGVAIVGPDHIGHGASPGLRCHLDRFDEYIAPLTSLRAYIADWYPETPVFLLGHSMGGLIAVHVLLEAQDDYRGAMFSGPAFMTDSTVPSMTIWIARLLRRLFPKMGMLTLNAQEVSRDPAVVADYIADPLVFGGKITASLGLEILDAMELAIRRAGELTLPVYIAHGDADVMAAPEGSKTFYEGLSSADKTLDFWASLYHEIFREPEAEEVIARYVSWLEAHL